MPEDLALSTRLFHLRYRSCPIYPDPKVCSFFIGWITLTHLCRTRTYAITGKNRWIAGVLYFIFTVQLVVGIYMIVRSVSGPGEYLSRPQVQVPNEKFQPQKFLKFPYRYSS